MLAVIVLVCGHPGAPHYPRGESAPSHHLSRSSYLNPSLHATVKTFNSCTNCADRPTRPRAPDYHSDAWAYVMIHVLDFTPKKWTYFGIHMPLRGRGSQVL